MLGLLLHLALAAASSCWLLLHLALAAVAYGGRMEMV
jgi:hypothetical protein